MLPADTARCPGRMSTAGLGHADRVYQVHHVSCGTCAAAGKNPDLQRCAEGAVLWDAYNQAGEPPHFLWLQRRQPTRKRV